MAEVVIASCAMPTASMAPPDSEEIRRKLTEEDATDRAEHEDSGDETTPTTTESECSEVVHDDDWDSELQEAPDTCEASAVEEQPDDVPQLGPGLFPPEAPHEQSSAAPTGAADMAEARREGEQQQQQEAAAAAAVAPQAAGGGSFTPQETLFIFDWDDTILPSSWIQRQGLRLDSGSIVAEWQRARLAEAATAALDTLRFAKQHGTVVLVTNAERGWIELSCQKFVPALLPIIENVKIVSARTSYEGPGCAAPLDWKVRAFGAEIARACGGAEALADPMKRKNIHSLGDSLHEREALIRATSKLPNCFSKSVKFVDRPDISQLIKQHALVAHCFEQIVQRDENLDLSIDCS